MIMNVQVFLEDPVFSSFCYTTRSEITGDYSSYFILFTYFFLFLKPTLLSTAAIPLHSQQKCIRVPFSPHSHWHLFLLLFFIVLFYFKGFIYLFSEREKGRDKERERNVNVWLPLMPIPGHLACNTSMCLDWELNWRPFGSQPGTQSTELQHPGFYFSFNSNYPNGYKVVSQWCDNNLLLWLINSRLSIPRFELPTFLFLLHIKFLKLLTLISF